MWFGIPLRKKPMRALPYLPSRGNNLTVALQVGREVRTPGLTKRRLTFEEIFSAMIVLVAWQKVRSIFAHSAILVIVNDRRVQLAA